MNPLHGQSRTAFEFDPWGTDKLVPKRNKKPRAIKRHLDIYDKSGMNVEYSIDILFYDREVSKTKPYYGCMSHESEFIVFKKVIVLNHQKEFDEMFPNFQAVYFLDPWEHSGEVFFGKEQCLKKHFQPQWENRAIFDILFMINTDCMGCKTTRQKQKTLMCIKCQKENALFEKRHYCSKEHQTKDWKYHKLEHNFDIDI